MSRYIDVDKMISDTKAMKQIADAITIEGIVKYLEENSLTDVVEIVCCKNCKWHNRKGYAIVHGYRHGEPSVDETRLWTKPDDFCSFAERKYEE